MTESAAAPTCYRHPDRETYVRCTRCDRPICPDCMKEAAVGFQCPECVREGSRSVRQARTVFGGRVGADANVTKVLIGLNVIAFVAQLLSSQFTDRFEMVSAAYDPRVQKFVGVASGEWYRMLTSAFLHSPDFLLHIAFNMYALLMFGTQVERLLGGLRYSLLYLVAALGGSVGTLLFLSPVTPSLGASGAVFGLFGAYFVLARKLRADTSQLVLLIGINLAIGFAAHGYINNYAHIGGLITGGLVALVYTQVPRTQTALHVAGAVFVGLVLVVVAYFKVHDLRREIGVDVPQARSVASVVTTSGTAAPSR
jgi:membrane associated rhomboid family serine protease